MSCSIHGTSKPKTQTNVGSNPMLEVIFCVFKKKKAGQESNRWGNSEKIFLWWGTRAKKETCITSVVENPKKYYD